MVLRCSCTLHANSNPFTVVHCVHHKIENGKFQSNALWVCASDGVHRSQLRCVYVCVCSTQFSMGKIPTTRHSSTTGYKQQWIELERVLCDGAQCIRRISIVRLHSRKPKPADINVAVNHFRAKSSTNKWIENFRSWIAGCRNKLYINFEYYEFGMCRRRCRRGRRRRHGAACRVRLPSNQPRRTFASKRQNKCVPNSHTAFIHHMLNSHNKLYLCTPSQANRVESASHSTTNEPQVVEQKLLIVFCWACNLPFRTTFLFFKIFSIQNIFVSCATGTYGTQRVRNVGALSLRFPLAPAEDDASNICFRLLFIFIMQFSDCGHFEMENGWHFHSSKFKCRKSEINSKKRFCQCWLGVQIWPVIVSCLCQSTINLRTHAPWSCFFRNANNRFGIETKVFIGNK